MTLAEKIKEYRKKAGLSQEQLSEKLCVSRQAVTKWESGKGIPDIENIKNISRLFNVSIDELLDDGETLTSSIIRESIDLSQYKGKEKRLSKYNAVVKEKYPKADAIYPLIRYKKLSKLEWILDLIISPGIFDVVHSVEDMSANYLVEVNNKQLLVKVTKEFMESVELTNKFIGKKKVINNYQFSKMRKL